MRKPLATALLSFLIPAGCQSDTYWRLDGPGRAGDAIAANTVLQMVDPWPKEAERTQLQVPADLEQYKRPTSRPGGNNQSVAATAVAP